MSAALISKGDTWREGDILTVLLYSATAAGSLPTVDTETAHVASSGYLQFILNSSDTTPLDEIERLVNNIPFGISVNNDGNIDVNGNDASFAASWAADLYQCAVIHSRNTAGGLLVSTQSMVANKPQVITDALAEDGTYYNAVLADWDAAAEAVLQGAAAANQ